MEDNIKFTQEYRYLVISDITAHFESIDHSLLRDYLRDYSNDQKMINLLMSILEFWAWKNELGYIIRRGIPQGFDTSAYVGNFFLDRMDKRVESQLSDDTKYLRYVDDIRVYTNSIEEARRIVLELNRAMRDINLIIKDSKCCCYLDRKHTLYKPYYLLLYEGGAWGWQSIIAKLLFNSGDICLNWLSNWGTFQKRVDGQRSHVRPTIFGSPDMRKKA